MWHGRLYSTGRSDSIDKLSGRPLSVSGFVQLRLLSDGIRLRTKRLLHHDAIDDNLYASCGDDGCCRTGRHYDPHCHNGTDTHAADCASDDFRSQRRHKAHAGLCRQGLCLFCSEQ